MEKTAKDSTIIDLTDSVKDCVTENADSEKPVVTKPKPRAATRPTPTYTYNGPVPADVFNVSVKTWTWVILAFNFIAACYKYHFWGADNELVPVFEVFGLDGICGSLTIPLAIMNYLFLLTLLAGRLLAIKHLIAPYMCWQLTITCGYILMTVAYGIQELILTQSAYHYPGRNFINMYFGQYSDVMYYINNSGDVRVGHYLLYPMVVHTLFHIFQGCVMYLLYKYYSLVWYIETSPYTFTDLYRPNTVVNVDC